MLHSWKMCAHEGFPPYIFVKRTWELKTVNFTRSCAGFVFLERACKTDLGTPRSASNMAHLSCLPWEGESRVRGTTEGRRTTARTLLRIPQSSWTPISFSVTEENARLLSEKALPSVTRNGVTTTSAVLVAPLIVFPDAMPMVPHATYLWQTVSGCSFAFYCVLRSFKSHLCSFKRL